VMHHPLATRSKACIVLGLGFGLGLASLGDQERGLYLG